MSFLFFSFSLKKKKGRLPRCKNRKNMFCFQLKNLLVYSLVSESGIFIFTNVRIRNTIDVH